MKSLFANPKKTFNLLSIGQRGVGKTVFLAGSYLELHVDGCKRPTQQLWFECQDSQAQENLESVLSYMLQTHRYPPPTMKVTSFSFDLKRQSSRGSETLSHFCWLDIPGEICKVHSLDFRRMVSSSHGCCIFVDAYALVHNPSYLQGLEDVVKQVEAIAALVNLNNLNYAFALVLTKCDLIESESFNQHQLEESIRPITERLDAVKANYQTFYSFIPLVQTDGTTTLEAKGAAAPFLWLVCELSKVHDPELTNGLFDFVTSRQTQQGEVDGLIPSLYSSGRKLSRGKKLLRKCILLLALVSIPSAAVAGLLLKKHQWELQSESTNLTTLSNLATLLQQGKYNQAIPLMEKLVQQQPEKTELRLQLAYLYELTDQLVKAETAYSQVLAQQKNNFKALVGKANVSRAQGDFKTAANLFLQAEQAAPADFKAQIRTSAREQLKLPVKPTVPQAASQNSKN